MEKPGDTKRAHAIRDRLIKDIGHLMDGAHYVDIVVRYEGRDIHLQFDWVKPYLRKS